MKPATVRACFPEAAFAKFDYVALGHLHGPQSIGRESVRYAGSPIKYSFSEARQKKSVTVLEMSGKGIQTIQTIPLIPLRDRTQRAHRQEDNHQKRRHREFGGDSEPITTLGVE